VHLDVRFSASPLDVSRIGIVVPRHQHSAVDRNRLKRRLRELVRLELVPALRDRVGAADIAIRSRREAYAATMDALRVDVRTVVDRLAAPSSSAVADARNSSPPNVNVVSTNVDGGGDVTGSQ
jgi:ribonuclease P protein component